jgi:hypothetical protein
VQIKGFMDQITPSAENISTFYKASASEIQTVIDGLLDEMDFNHYTFYTKWYTNGIKSSLSFLANHPVNLNVRTDNRAFREVIDFLHGRGLSVGAMFQIYTYESDRWGGGHKWGQWDVTAVTGIPFVAAMADATSPVFRGRLWAMMAEYVRLFPETDYIFIEGEGQFADQIRNAFRGWCAVRGINSPEQLTYTDEVKDYCEHLGIPLDITWSDEGMEFAVEYSQQNYAVIEDALRSNGFQGEIGVVFHIYNVESFYMPRALLHSDWWLLPWHYFGWDQDKPEYTARLEASKQHLLNWKHDGYKVCYLGDATIGRGYLPPILELWELSREQLDGYLCMGTPNVDLGLRWKGVTDDMVRSIRQLYREKIFVK